MVSENDKANRRFTVIELLVYVSTFSLAIGILRAEVNGPSLPPVIFYCYSLAIIVALCLLGSLIGIAIAMLLVGRRGAVGGCVVGPFFLYIVLLIVFFSIFLGQQS